MTQQPRASAAKALLSDEALAAQLRGGDANAFAVLAQRYGGRLAGFGGKVLGSQSLAEDVVQDVFIKLWQRPGLFDPAKARFRTWVHRVVLNRCLDHKRRKQGVALEDIAEPIAPDAAQDDVMIRDGRDALVRQAMTQLPERQRAALALCYLDDLSNKEAADIMDLNIKALESLLTRARANLKTALSPMKEQLL
jgi:RNA polymerase sigma-70 factor (ECF subfamily)